MPNTIRNRRTQEIKRQVASFTITSTGSNQTFTFGLTVSAPSVVTWGDGTYDVYTSAHTCSHTYATSGVWNVRILQPHNVIRLVLSNSAFGVNSANLSALENIQEFRASLLRNNSIFNSADITRWRPAIFFLASLQSGAYGVFNSADIASWRPETFVFTHLPSGFSGVFNSADIREWSPNEFQVSRLPSSFSGVFDNRDLSAWTDIRYFSLYTLPSTFTFNIGGGFSRWESIYNFSMQDNRLQTEIVDKILYDLYTATCNRISLGGEIALDGNASPSGFFSPPVSCPVTSETPGKQIAYELLNDSCGIRFMRWDDVIID